MNAGDPAAAGGLSPGAKLGRYQVIRRLAVGGMAELYLARHVEVAGYQKVVAVKRVLAHLAEDAEFVRMFLNEARLAAGLDHSNIAHVIDFGSDGGEHFMAMEYVHGKSVHHMLKQAAGTGGTPLPCALTIAAEVAAALHYAHERAGPDGRPLGLVHRDVSPSNVLVSYDGDVKLVDFGIAKATAHTRATRTGTIKGKLGYMSPEQLKGEALDRRADVFSLGVVAYELTTGGRCFFAEGEFALINKVAAARFDRPSSIVEGYPPALEEIVVKALSADPEQRWATAREFQVAIEAFATQEGLALSKVALSDHMHRVFGHEDYPKTDMIPVPTQVASSTSATQSSYDPSFVRSRRRRITAGWIVGALAAGLAVGLGAQRLFGDDEPPAAPQPSAIAAPPTPAAAGEPQPAPEEEPVIVVPDDEPVPEKRAPSRTKVRRKPHKTKAKAPPPKADPPQPASGKKEYLPPSRRGD